MANRLGQNYNQRGYDASMEVYISLVALSLCRGRVNQNHGHFDLEKGTNMKAAETPCAGDSVAFLLKD